MDLTWLRGQLACDLEVPDVRLTPRGDQLVGAAAIICTPRLVLTDDCGLGKSGITLMALRCLLASGHVERALLLCPGKLTFQWEAEVEKWFGDAITAQVVHGTPAQRKKAYDALARNFGHPLHHVQLVIVGYEVARNDAKHLMALRWDQLICDEASAFRHRETLLHKTLAALSPAIPRRQAITATPVQNHLDEYQNILEVVEPAALGSRDQFLKDYCLMWHYTIPIKLKNGRIFNKKIEKIKGYKNLDTFKSKISQVTFGRTIDELKAAGVRFPDLLVGEPGLDRWLEMTPEQERRYADIEQGILSDAAGHAEPLSLFTQLTRLQQLAVDPRLVFPGDGPGAKILELESLLTGELSGRQVVLFSKYLEFHKRCTFPLLKKLGLTYAEIHGQVGDRAAEEGRRAFQLGERQVCVITTAGEMGLNLDSAAIMVCCDTLINEARMRQIYGRICRSSSAHSVATVYQLLSKNSIEERLLLRREQRGALLDWLDDADQYTPGRMQALIQLVNRSISLVGKVA